MTTLTVRIRNTLYDRRQVYAFHVREFNDYYGTVVPRPSWVGDDYFCLSTNDPEFPFRVLSKADIVCGWRHIVEAPTPKVKRKPDFRALAIAKSKVEFKSLAG